jgi:hypothetical protein
MSQLLDYATPQPRQLDIAKRIVATLPLSLGVIAYASLCRPAALQRGYPPIDPIWTAVTYLWPFPVLLFALCWPRSRFSKTALLLYAVVSGYIDACTVVMMTPHRFSFIDAMFNSVLIIPMHLVGVVAIASIGRFAISRFDASPDTDWTYRQRTGRIAAFIIILAVGIVFPFVFRRAAILHQEKAGVDLADDDWAAHTAVIRSSEGWESEHSFGDATITSYFDVNSGLPLKSDMHMGFEQSYENRIHELLQTHGVPPWSQKTRLVSDADLTSMLAATTMKAITAFPYDAAPGIVLIRNGSISRWGGSMSSASNDLSIASQFSGLSGFGSSTDTAYVGRLEKYPGVVFVRCGQKWVAACTDDGWILGYASRNWP